MMLIAICPKDTSHQKFLTQVQVVSTWEVDRNGALLREVIQIEKEIVPAPRNAWTCAVCGAPALVTKEDSCPPANASLL